MQRGIDRAASQERPQPSESQREQVYAILHDTECEEEPQPHSWREHLPWDDDYYEKDAAALADALIAHFSQERPQPDEALEAFREILTKLIRQYHGVAHSHLGRAKRGGSWLYCDDRWCSDIRTVLSIPESEEPR